MPAAPLILVIDDDRDICRVIGEFLQEQGYRVALAHDPLTAEGILDHECPALVIADIALRGGSGFQSGELATARAVPTLFISGKPIHIEQMAGGPVPFLQKPFRLDDLKREVERLLLSRHSLPA